MTDKWSDEEIVQFLDLYREQEILWNPKLELYRNNSARLVSIRKIIDGLKKPQLSANDLKIKIKNVRTSYKRELRKVLKSKKCGSGTNNIYKPVLRWFDKADRFLRPVSEERPSKSNFNLQRENIDYDTIPNLDEEIITDASETITVQVSPRNVTSNLKMRSGRTRYSKIYPIEKEISELDSTIPNLNEDGIIDTSETSTVPVSPKNINITSNFEMRSDRTRYSKISSIEQLDSIIPNLDEDGSTDTSETSNVSFSISKLDGISKGSIQEEINNFGKHMKTEMRKDISPIERAISKLDSIVKGNIQDEFDIFAKHVATQMRQIPLERALIVQSDIQTILTRERILYLRKSPPPLATFST